MKTLQTLLFAAVLCVGMAVVTTGQITPPYSFTSGTTIRSSEVNANFNKLLDALNRTGGTVTGAIASSGGSLTGTWAGSPTFSGTVTCATCGFFDTYTAKTSNFTAAATEGFFSCDASGGAVTATLPAAATAGAGRVYTMKKIDSSANACTYDGNASETIDGSTTFPITTQYNSLTIVSTGSAWLIR